MLVSREMEMGKKMKLYRDVVPLTVLATMECLNVGLNTLFKAATLHGMNHRIFMVYVYGVASLILLPSPFLSHRSKALPPVSFSLLWKVFLLGVIGCVSQEMGYAGISYSSPTLASAMSNLIPAFTFILASTFRMEKLALKSRSSQAKIIGTIVSLMGAFVVTLYKGPAIILSGSGSGSSSIPSNWIIGAICLMSQNIMIPICYILQTHIIKEYKDEKTIIFLYNLCVAILAAFVGLVTERDVNAWRSPIGLSIGLASVLCSGVFGSFLNDMVHSWALKKKGPVYVTMFKPLSIAIAVVMGIIFLGDTLYLGSIIGVMVILVGFYTVMWGKAREEIREDSEIGDLESPSKEKVPLLNDNKSVEEK